MSDWQRELKEDMGISTTRADIRDVQKQLAEVQNDPDMTITTGGFSFDLKSVEETINDIMYVFPFRTVREYMVKEDWKWGSEIPNIKEIESTARLLLKGLEFGVDEKGYACSITGGFAAWKFQNRYGLLFGRRAMDAADWAGASNFHDDQSCMPEKPGHWTKIVASKYFQRRFRRN
jgi:hypothetical protein